jgi:hypothetical protein
MEYGLMLKVIGAGCLCSGRTIATIQVLSGTMTIHMQSYKIHVFLEQAADAPLQVLHAPDRGLRPNSFYRRPACHTAISFHSTSAIERCRV